MTTNPGGRAPRPPPCRGARRARARGARRVRRLRREGELDELHLRHRVEDVQRDEALGRAAGRGERADRQRRGRRREHGVRAGDGAQLAEQLGLRRRGPRRSPRRGRSCVASASRSVEHLTWLGVDLAAQPAADLVHGLLGALGRVVASAPTARPRHGARRMPPARTRSRRPLRCPAAPSCAGTVRDAAVTYAHREEPHEWAAGPRGRHRRCRAHADRARAQGEGLLQGHPPGRPARQDLHRADQPHRHRRRRGRDRARGLRAAVRRAGVQHRPQRVAAGGPAARDLRHDARPAVRLGAAGRGLGLGAGRLRHPRRRRSARASSTWATSRSPTG